MRRELLAELERRSERRSSLRWPRRAPDRAARGRARRVERGEVRIDHVDDRRGRSGRSARSRLSIVRRMSGTSASGGAPAAATAREAARNRVTTKLDAIIAPAWYATRCSSASSNGLRPSVAGQPARARQSVGAVRRDPAPRAVELLRAARRHQRLQRMDAEAGDMGIERRQRRRAAHVGQPRARQGSTAPPARWRRRAQPARRGRRARSRARAAPARPDGRRWPIRPVRGPRLRSCENMTRDHDIALLSSWGSPSTRGAQRRSPSRASRSSINWSYTSAASTLL